MPIDIRRLIYDPILLEKYRKQLLIEVNVEQNVTQEAIHASSESDYSTIPGTGTDTDISVDKSPTIISYNDNDDDNNNGRDKDNNYHFYENHLNKAIQLYESLQQLQKEYDMYQSQIRKEQRNTRNIHNNNIHNNNNNNVIVLDRDLNCHDDQNTETDSHQIIIRQQQQEQQIQRKNRIKEYTNQIQTTESSLYMTLSYLPNIIDDDIIIIRVGIDMNQDNITINHIFDTVNTMDDQINLDDPLYCTKCYEEMVVSKYNHHHDAITAIPSSTIIITKTILNGPGIVLSQQINHYFISSIQEYCNNNYIIHCNNNNMNRCMNSATTNTSNIPNITVYNNLPSSIECIPKQEFSNLWGIDWFYSNVSKTTNSFDKVDTTTTSSMIMIPSWITILNNHSGTYWDKHLPRIFILHHVINQQQQEQQQSQVCILNDPREKYNVQSYHTTRTTNTKNKMKKKLYSNNNNNNHISLNNWYTKLITYETIQLLMIVGPSLKTDSRKYQIQMIQYILVLYQQLLTVNDEKTINVVPNQTHQQQAVTSIQQYIRIRIVPSNELMLMESSRIVIEGYIYDTGTMNPICLAYISNLQDYGTRNTYRYGSSSNCRTTSGLHVLHGTICHTAQTMTWIAQHSKRHHSSSSQCLHLPSRLLSYSTIDQQRSLYLLDQNNDANDDHDQSQNITKNNNNTGNYKLLYVREIIGISKNGRRITKDIVRTNHDSMTSHRNNLLDDDKLENTKNHDMNEIKNQYQPKESLLPQLSIDRIRGEALSSPFHSFFPFSI